MSSFVQNLRPYRDGLGLLVLGTATFFIFFGNPLHDFQLMSRGVTVTGVATEVNDFEEREDNGTVSRYFFIKYDFTTADGQKFSDVVEVQGKPSHMGIGSGQPLEIQYLPDAPGIHRVKAISSVTPKEWIIKYSIFGFLAIAPGLFLIFRAHQTKGRALKRAT